MTMLNAAFIDWWFAPWMYADAKCRVPIGDSDLLGRRDAYRLWCSDAGVEPAFPERFDPAWQVAALEDGILLASAAKLFGGLIAARRQQRGALAQLALADRKWCMSIASVQPLQEQAEAHYAPDESIEVRGLTELSSRLERDFPGMWSRLRLLLQPELDSRVQALLEKSRKSHVAPEPAPQRALRCWQLCRRRAAES